MFPSKVKLQIPRHCRRKRRSSARPKAISGVAAPRARARLARSRRREAHWHGRAGTRRCERNRVADDDSTGNLPPPLMAAVTELTLLEIGRKSNSNRHVARGNCKHPPPTLFFFRPFFWPSPHANPPSPGVSGHPHVRASIPRCEWPSPRAGDHPQFVKFCPCGPSPRGTSK